MAGDFTALRTYIYASGAIIFAARHNTNEVSIFTAHNNAFNSVTGHQHTGAAGDAPLISATGLNLTAAYAWIGAHSWTSTAAFSGATTFTSTAAFSGATTFTSTAAFSGATTFTSTAAFSGAGTLTGTVPFKTDSANSLFDVYSAGAGVYYGRTNRYTARGTVAVPTISQNGDQCSFDASYLYDGDQYLQASQDYVYSATAPANNATTANRLFALSAGGAVVSTVFGMFGANTSIGLRDGGRFYLDMDSGGTFDDTYLYHTANSMVFVAGGSSSFQASAGSFTIGNAGNATLTLGGAPSINGSGAIKLTTSNTQINWQIGNNFVASGDFTITPSTAAGGNTFTTPVASFSNAGKLTLTQEMLLPDVDPPTANYINRNSGVKGWASMYVDSASSYSFLETYNVSSVSVTNHDAQIFWDTNFTGDYYSVAIGYNVNQMGYVRGPLYYEALQASVGFIEVIACGVQV